MHVQFVFLHRNGLCEPRVNAENKTLTCVLWYIIPVICFVSNAINLLITLDLSNKAVI